VAEPLVSVIESTTYLVAARKLLSEAERARIVDLLAADPECGDVIRGGGGIRKVRNPLAGRGKSGGAGVIYYFHSAAIPLLLITVFAKNAMSDLSDADVAALAKEVKIYAKAWNK
jgi:hypothetical protein